MAYSNKLSVNNPLSLFMELPVRNDIIDIETDDPLNNLDSHTVTATCIDIWKRSSSSESLIIKIDIDNIINKEENSDEKLEIIVEKNHFNESPKVNEQDNFKESPEINEKEDDFKESFEITKSYDDFEEIDEKKVDMVKDNLIEQIKEEIKIESQVESAEKDIRTRVRKVINFFCCLCEKKFTSKKLFLNHGQNKHFTKELKGFKCLKCCRIFKHFNKFCLHITEKHATNASTTIQNDKSNESDEKKFYKMSLCHICGKTFNFVGQYREHLLKHNNIRNYVCKICQKSFISKRLLTVHQKIHDSMEDRKFICGHIFTSNDETGENISRKKSNTIIPSMQYIIRNEHGERVCNFACVSKSDLTKHRSIHSNLKPFRCHICNTCFRQSSHLRRHIKRHSGKKDYICEICKMGFVTKDNLNNHLRTHSGVLPFICEICGKTLLQRSQCLKHVAKCNMNPKVGLTTSKSTTTSKSSCTMEIKDSRMQENLLQNDYLLGS